MAGLEEVVSVMMDYEIRLCFAILGLNPGNERNKAFAIVSLGI